LALETLPTLCVIWYGGKR